MIREIFNTNKLITLTKNKYGTFVIHKFIKTMTREEKFEIKTFLINKLTTCSSKDKGKLNNLISLF